MYKERRGGMVSTFYISMLVLSLMLTMIYVFMWHRHFDIHITLVFVLVPIANVGYYLFANSDSVDTVIASVKLTYIGGCFLLLIVMFSVFSLCDIHLNRFIRLGAMLFSVIVYLSTFTIGKNELFYKSISISNENGIPIVHKVYGPLHSLYYVLIVLYFIMSVSAMTYSYFKKKQVSRRIIYLLFLSEALPILAHFVGRMVTNKLEIVPAVYVMAQLIYLMIIYRMCLYDITDTAIESLVQRGDTGFISFDLKYRYLGSNVTAKNVFPELNELTVDKPVDGNELITNTALKWLKNFEKNNKLNEVLYEKADSVYLINLTYLYDGPRKRGYQLYITDDTKDQRYIKLLNTFNDELRNEVTSKTKHIVEMHNKLILSMAAMVESRDNSTGGHIKRTSQCVRILIDEIRREGRLQLTDSFCRNIIKAAPMHDLGKIAVDDEILRKPGRFTPEEFEKMKAHAAEGARIVSSILDGTDDDEFRTIAVNVAHFHHERWDGSGYPEGLKGEKIPLEARIMAIADVYDALVSKRVYKESMSFEKADSIIMDGMGKQFDKQLQPYYESARPRLEEYYRSLEVQ